MNYFKLFGGLMSFSAILAFSACSSDDDGPQDPTTITKYSIAVTLTDAGFDLGEGNTLPSSFAAGDEAGIFVVKNGSAVVDNGKLTYNGTVWTSDNILLDDTDGAVMLYYPYSSTATGKVNLSADNAADFFSTYVAIVGSPANDQSEFDTAVKPYDVLFGQAYRSKSDHEITVEGVNYNVSVSHSLAAVSWTLPGGTAYTTTDGFAYSTPGGSTLTSVKLGEATVVPATVNGRKTFFYTAGSDKKLTVNYSSGGADKTATLDLDAAAGTVKTVAIEGGSSDGGVRDLKVGDLYYCDGSVFPVEQLASVAIAPEGVAGVVFCVDPARFSEEETALLGQVHALVVSAKMALKNNKANYMPWCDAYPKPGEDGDGRYIDSAEDPAYPGMFLPLIEDRTDYAASYELNNSDIKGYLYSSIIRIRRSEEIAAGYYPTFQAINNLAVAVPVSTASTTGWYLPSVGQLLDVMRGLGGAKVEAANAQKYSYGEMCDFNFLPESTTNLVENLDASIAKIADNERDDFDNSDYCLWTSSYGKAYNSYVDKFMPAAREVLFDSNVLYVISYDIIGKGNVRGVLAF